MNSYASRAGTVVRQMAGYRAFVPVSLPPEPPVDMAGFQKRLSRADRALGRRAPGELQTSQNWIDRENNRNTEEGRLRGHVTI